MQEALTLEQKRTLYRDGYVIVRNAVPEHLVAAAKRRIDGGEGLLSKAPAMTDLVNSSSVTPILHEAMGQFDAPIACQVGVRPVSEPGDHFNNLGYRERDMPYYAAEPHVDGSMTIRIPQQVQEGARRTRSIAATLVRVPRATWGEVPTSSATTWCRCSRIRT